MPSASLSAFPVPGWQARPQPPRTPMTGRTCDVVPLDPDRHAPELHEANLENKDGGNFTYLGAGPFASLAEYRQWIDATCLGSDPLFHAIIDKSSGKAVGIASYLRIDPAKRRDRGRPHQLFAAAAAQASPRPKRCT